MTVDYLYLGGYCTDPCQLTVIIGKGNDSTIKIKSLCGGGSAGGGGGGAASALTDVKNKVKDQCIKKVVDQIMQSKLNSNTITDILNNIFSINSNINITFVEDPTMVNSNGEPVDARTSHNPNSINPTDIVISLNTTTLTGTSQEYKAATIIHEIIHASLDVSNASLSTPIDFYSQYFQHSDMLEKYMEDMSSGLHDFFPYLSMNAARSLCLNGLGDTVTNSQEFTNYITKWGFNRNPSSPDNWAALMFQYKVAENIGIKCNVGGSGKQVN
jgi:hypothetical protein